MRTEWRLKVSWWMYRRYGFVKLSRPLDYGWRTLYPVLPGVWLVRSDFT